MKKLFALIALVAVLGSGLVGSARAQNTVSVLGTLLGQGLQFTSPKSGGYFAGEYMLQITTPSNTISTVPGWCVDFYTDLAFSFSAGNVADPQGIGTPMQQVCYILHQFELAYGPTDSSDAAAAAAAATQLAVWKVLDPTNTYTVVQDYDNPGDLSLVVSMASTLATQSVGKNALLGNFPVSLTVTNTQGSGTTVNALVTLTEGGLPVVGELVSLTASNGTFSGTNTITGVTDTNGQIKATLTSSLPVTVTATATATPMNIVQPTAQDQALMATLGATTYTASDTLSKSKCHTHCGGCSDGGHHFNGGCNDYCQKTSQCNYGNWGNCGGKGGYSWGNSGTCGKFSWGQNNNCGGYNQNNNWGSCGQNNGWGNYGGGCGSWGSYNGGGNNCGGYNGGGSSWGGYGGGNCGGWGW